MVELQRTRLLERQIESESALCMADTVNSSKSASSNKHCNRNFNQACDCIIAHCSKDYMSLIAVRFHLTEIVLYG